MARPLVVTNDMRAQGNPVYHDHWDIEPFCNVRAFGAKGDGITDDTAAIQRAIECACLYRRIMGIDRTVPVFFPAGTYMISNLILRNTTYLQGFQEQSRLYAIPGTVGNMISDAGNAQDIIIKQLSISGENEAVTGLSLGHGTYQFGGGSSLRDVFMRNCANYGFIISANAAWFDTLQVTDCGFTNTTMAKIEGGGNHFTNCNFSSKQVGPGGVAIGFEVDSLRDSFTNLHFESTDGFSIACIDCTGRGNLFSNINVTLSGDATIAAILRFQANNFGNIVNGITVFGSGILTSMINDLSTGSQRMVLGTSPYVNNYYLKHYVSDYGYIDRTATAKTPPAAGTWLQGDVAFSRQTQQGYPPAFVCSSSGMPGTWAAMPALPGAVEKTSDYILTANDIGKRFSNHNAGGMVTFSLPVGVIGMSYEFIRVTSQIVRIDPSGNQIIRGGGPGKYLQLDNDGDNVHLMWLNPGIWEIACGCKGTPSFEA